MSQSTKYHGRTELVTALRGAALQELSPLIELGKQLTPPERTPPAIDEEGKTTALPPLTEQISRHAKLSTNDFVTIRSTWTQDTVPPHIEPSSGTSWPSSANTTLHRGRMYAGVREEKYLSRVRVERIIEQGWMLRDNSRPDAMQQPVRALEVSLTPNGLLRGMSAFLRPPRHRMDTRDTPGFNPALTIANHDPNKRTEFVRFNFTSGKIVEAHKTRDMPKQVPFAKYIYDLYSGSLLRLNMNEMAEEKRLIKEDSLHPEQYQDLIATLLQAFPVPYNILEQRA